MGRRLPVRLPQPGLPVAIRDLYRRGLETLFGSWEAYARGSGGAELIRGHGFAAAVFPTEPERAIYNNAVLDRGLGRQRRRETIDALASVYAEAGVDRYAAWAHDGDGPMRAELDGGPFLLAETTRVMGRSLEDLDRAAGEVEVEPFDWPRYLAYLTAEGLPEGLLSGVDPSAFHVLGVRLDGRDVASAIAFDHDGDCGIFNMGTLEPFRRRGLGGAVLARHLEEAADRGCSTASLQSTPIAEGVYRAAGFRDLGRFLEYVPQGSGSA